VRKLQEAENIPIWQQFKADIPTAYIPNESTTVVMEIMNTNCPPPPTVCLAAVFLLCGFSLYHQMSFLFLFPCFCRLSLCRFYVITDAGECSVRFGWGSRRPISIHIAPVHSFSDPSVSFITYLLDIVKLNYFIIIEDLIW
jgi:hypothetical protein